MNWNDLRFVLAIARGGTLSAAALRLGVDQTTVGRRLTAIETELGAPLFSRSRHGFELSEVGELIVNDIEQMESSAMRLADKVGTQKDMPSGIVRVATMPWILSNIIAPALPSFLAKQSAIELHGLADLKKRSLLKKEAEMSLRFELQPSGGEVARALADISYSVYAHRHADPDKIAWAGAGVDIVHVAPESWLRGRLADGQDIPRFRSDDVGIIQRAVQTGAVKALLPDILAESDPQLRRLTSGQPDIVRQLRVLIHPDVERLERVRFVIDWLYKVFERAGLRGGSQE